MVSIQSEEDFDKDVLDSRLDSEKAPLLSASDAASDRYITEYRSTELIIIYHTSC